MLRPFPLRDPAGILSALFEVFAIAMTKHTSAKSCSAGDFHDHGRSPFALTLSPSLRKRTDLR